MSDNETVPVVDYLVGEGLAEWRTSTGVAITHAGVVMVENQQNLSEATATRPESSYLRTHPNMKWILVTIAAAALGVPVTDGVNYSIGILTGSSFAISSLAWLAFGARIFAGTVLFPFVFLAVKVTSPKKTRRPLWGEIGYASLVSYGTIFVIAWILDILSGRFWPFF